MSENRKESLERCSCSVYTSGYGSSVHYLLCARCAGGGYRSSLTRRERLEREREDRINSVRVSTDMLTAESLSGEQLFGMDETFRTFLRESIDADVRKIREISSEIGSIRPVVTDKKHHD